MSSDSGCNVSIVEISAGTNKIVEVAEGTSTIVEIQTQGPKGPNFDPSLSPAYTNPANNDLLPIYDVANGVAKKITLEDLIATRARDSRRIYLSKDARASDSNNGTSQEEPLLTFAAAIAAAEPGDVIEVSPGTYTETSLPLRVKRDVGIFAKSLRQVKIQPAAGQEMNGFFKVDSGFWVWGLEFAGHQADLANNQQSWAISFDDQADNTAAPLNASGLGAFILKSPYVQNCSSITAEDDAGTAGSVSAGDTGGGIEVDGDKCAANSPIRSMVVDSYTQVNLGGPGAHVLNDGYGQFVSFFGTFCTFHVKADTGGQANLSGGGTTDFGDQGLVADGYSRLPNFTGTTRVASYGADRAEASVTIDVSTDTFTTVSAHPLVANDQITLNATDGTLPTGLAEATTYFVISSGLTSNNFKISLTQGGSSVDITGAASGTYQFVRQGQLTADVVSLTSNRIGTKSRPNPGQLMFPHATFPSAGEPGSAGNAVSVTAGAGGKFTVTLNSFSYGHEYVTGGTVTVGGTSYNVSSAVYDNATGIVTLSATGYTPVTGDSAVLAGLQFICPIQGAYTITGSVPIDASGNVVANDSPSLAGYRLNFYNTVNGGLRAPLTAGQPLDFRLRSQISCALHTMEFVGAGTNYNALPWNGGVPIPASQRVELNNGRVFGATINEKGDFEIGDGTFSIDGTTGQATINTSQFNLSGLNFVGPFSRNGGFSTVGVQLKEVSANTSLIASTGAADGNTAPTQSAVKAYVDSTTVQSVDLSAPTGFTSSGGPVTGSGTLDLAFDTGYQGFLTAESTKLSGIENNATADQTAAEIRSAYLSNSDTNNFSDAAQTKLAGIEANATQDQSASEIKALYESNSDTNNFNDAAETKLAGIENNATADQTDAEIKTAYENNANTNAFTDAEQSKLSGIEANATQDQTAVEIKTAYESNGDTNAYTDAEQTKLAGIETNATQDQSATEIKTAYESNADTNAFTDTEKTKLAGIETGATADQTDAEIKTAYENNSNTNAFTDAEQTKLGGIEAGAQVNVATNLSYTSGTRVVSSSTGADATLPLAIASGDAGLLTGADKTQLDNLSTNLAGKANLSGGKLALSEVPDLAITEFKGTVANQSAMLAITGQPGDWVVRSDDGKVYIITGSDPSQLSNWTALSYPASDVLSVNGLTGAVVLDADDISDASTTKKFTTAAEISKLAGIEAGATADQTDAEIKTAYENNSNTNAFTDAEQSKLSGIEAGATADQSASEIKTAYESNSDTNVFDDAAVSKLSGIEAGATADQTAAEIKTAYESNADTNEFSDAEQTKLAGIATGAQVNVATNLSYTASTRTVASSTGTDAVISEAVASGDSGLITGSDKAKLDGIEAGATADQSASEIKTAYESNSDTNVFNDAAETKLAGIEAGAQVNVATDLAYNSSTRTVSSSTGTNATIDEVVASGDSGLITGADKAKLDGIESGATADQTASQIKTAFLSNSDTNNFDDAAESKLSGIEANATQDQTAAEILTAIKTVDGSGSGLDADLLDGLQGSSFLRSDASDTATGQIKINNGTANPLELERTSQVGIELNDTSVGSRYLGVNGGNLFYGSNLNHSINNKVWHEGNDGSGSGLDADLLDGQEGSYYLDYGNFSNTPTIPTNNNQLTNGAGFITSTLTNEQVQDITGGMVTGNTETGITVTYQDSDGTLDFAVASQTDNNFTTTLKNKLDGIESGATADQTAGEIKTAYLSNSDTNNFDDAAETKLAGIESNATQDQTAAEILTAVKTVDGSGSGLDADLLDGQEGSYYLDYGNFSNTPTIPTNNNQLTNGAGFITATLTEEQVEDFVGGMVTGNTETGIAVTYQDADGTLDFVVASQTDENFTTTLKNKLDGVASGAEVNVNADWNSSSGDSQILNKPTIPAAYTDSSVDSHLNTSTASSNEVLSWTGTDYDWVAQSGGGGAATQITVADESSDTTCFPVFVTDGGTVPPKVDFGSLQYNSSTGNLTATSFTGSASGLTGIQLTTADETSDTTCFPVFVTNGGAQDPKVDFSNFQYNSSTGNLTATKFTGDGSGLTNLPGGGGGATDLSYTAGTRVIASSTGTDATLPLMSSGNAGLVPASGGGTTNFLRADGTFTAIAASNPVALKLPIATSATLPTSNTEAQVSSIFGGTAVFNSSNSASWAFDASSITVPEDGIYCVSISVQVTSTGARATNLFGFAVDGTAQQGRSSHSYVRNSSSINEAGCTLTELLELDAGDVLTVIGRAEGSITTSRSTASTPGSIEIHKVSNTQGPRGETGAAGPSNIPPNSQTGAYTLVASDDGKHINITTGGVTVPSGVFSAGDVVTVYNNSGSNQTITQGSSVTLRLAGTATTSNRVLATYGLCTILCVASNTFVISGAGLT